MNLHELEKEILLCHFHSKRLSKFKSTHQKSNKNWQPPSVISLCDTDSTSSIMWFIQLASPESIIIQWVTLLQEEHYTLFWISVSRKWKEYELELEISQKSVYVQDFFPTSNITILKSKYEQVNDLRT